MQRSCCAGRFSADAVIFPPGDDGGRTRAALREGEAFGDQATANHRTRGAAYGTMRQLKRAVAPTGIASRGDASWPVHIQRRYPSELCRSAVTWRRPNIRMNRGGWFRTTPPGWTSRTLPSLRAAESHRGRNRKVPAIHSVLLRDRVDNRSTRVNHGRLPGERQDASAPSAHSPDKRSACAARDAALASGCGAWRRPRCGGRTAGPAALASRSPGGRRAVLAAAMSGVSHVTNILYAAQRGPQPPVVARHRLVNAALVPATLARVGGSRGLVS